MLAKIERPPKEVHLAQAGLADLPEGWDVMEVGELITEDRGVSVGVMYPGDHDPLGIPLIKVGDMLGSIINPHPEFRISPEVHKEYRRTELEGGELLLTLVGGLGQCAVVPESMAGWNAARAVAVIRLKEQSDAPFLRLCLLSEPLQHLINAWANTTVQATLNLKEVRLLPVPWPPKSERDTLTRIVGSLDDKIELNRRMNETLEALAQSLFKSWFVDATQSALPKGWRESTVDDEFNLTMGQSPPGESYNETGNGIPFYQGRTDFGFRFPTVRVFCTAPTRFANAGDTLVSVRAPVGSVNIATEKCAVGRGVAAARHKSGSRSYTYYFMRSLEADFACFEGEGTVFGSINKADFHAIKRAAPPSEIIEAFEKMLFPIDQRIENNEKESRTLAALRDALLPKLLSGELRVPTHSKQSQQYGKRNTSNPARNKSPNSTVP